MDDRQFDDLLRTFVTARRPLLGATLAALGGLTSPLLADARKKKKKKKKRGPNTPCDPPCGRGECYRGRCSCNSRDNLFMCGETCCWTGDTCIDNACCTAARSCAGTCCPEGQECVDDFTCCPRDQLCRGRETDTCCPAGQRCNWDGDTCCDPAQYCWGECCPAGQVCVNEKVCCPEDQACGDACCAEGEICVSGICRPLCPAGETWHGGMCCAAPLTIRGETCCPTGGGNSYHCGRFTCAYALSQSGPGGCDVWCAFRDNEESAGCGPDLPGVPVPGAPQKCCCTAYLTATCVWP